MSNLFNYGTYGVIVGSNSPYNWLVESTGAVPINGVQSSQVSLTYGRQDIMDWAGGGDPVLATRPQATLDFSYVFGYGVNEGNLGFVLNSGIPALSNLNLERNYYVLINQANFDQIGYKGTNNYTLAFGNGVITKYDFRAAVSQPSVCSVSVDCLNMLIQGTGSGNAIPSINQQNGSLSTGIYNFPPFNQGVTGYFEAAPSQILLNFGSGSVVGTLMSGSVFCPVQDFSFSVSTPRMATKSLGWAYPSSRPIRWPVTISINANAYLNGMQVDALNKFLPLDSGISFGVSFYSGVNKLDFFSFQFQNAKLNNQSVIENIGNSTKVSLSWSVNIYDINATGGIAGNFFMV
jgi:hypothetical protein